MNEIDPKEGMMPAALVALAFCTVLVAAIGALAWAIIKEVLS